MPSKFGNDFRIGERFSTPAMTVTEAHVVGFAGLTGDFYPLHVDAEYAARTQFGARLVHGPLVFSIAVGLVSLSGVLADSAVAWLGAESLRMHAPVRIGDTLHVSVEVKSLRPTRQPTRGVLVLVYSVINQRGETVLSFDHQLMAHLRTTGD